VGMKNPYEPCPRLLKAQAVDDALVVTGQDGFSVGADGAAKGDGINLEASQLVTVGQLPQPWPDSGRLRGRSQ
jgi:hypothetical protein